MELRIIGLPRPEEVENSALFSGSPEGLHSSVSDVPVNLASFARTGTDSSSRSGSVDTPEHVDLCPVGGGGTRWYLCRQHPQALVFQAGSGRVDSVANSCPVCGNLSALFTNCTCEYAPHPLDRASRPGRQIRRRDALAE